MQIDLSQPQPTKPRNALQARQGLFAALVGFLCFLVFFLYNFQTVIVQGKSMIPTLRDKQHILICKALWLVGKPKVGDIVVVKMENGEYIVKRVLRTGGEHVDPTLSPTGWDYFMNGEFVVPEGMIYIIGDNLPHSEDSRTFGPVPEGAIVGKLIWR